MSQWFPKCPDPFYGPEDWDGIGSIEEQEYLCDFRILYWKEAYKMLTPWQRFRFDLGFNVEPHFDFEFFGATDTWGIFKKNTDRKERIQ